MASGATLEKLRQLYSRADAEVRRWAAVQVRPTGRARCSAAPCACVTAAAAAVAAAEPSLLPPLLPSAQEQALSLLGTIANILARLPALEDARACGALAALPGHPQLRERLLAKQLAALDSLIVQLQGCLEDMQARPRQLWLGERNG